MKKQHKKMKANQIREANRRVTERRKKRLVKGRKNYREGDPAHDFLRSKKNG